MYYKYVWMHICMDSETILHVKKTRKSASLDLDLHNEGVIEV